ncbi:MAG: monovalent cation/H(+) antiporter subunit G [Mycobacteriales bacterium]
MTVRGVVVDVLLASSLLVVVLSVFGALVLRTTLAKVHYVTPVTSVAGPLFAAALVVDTGWGITAGLDILIAALMAVSGPLLGMAIGRVEAQQQGLIPTEGPQ